MRFLIYLQFCLFCHSLVITLSSFFGFLLHVSTLCIRDVGMSFDKKNQEKTHSCQGLGQIEEEVKLFFNPFVIHTNFL